jgi:hypothetical protein
MMPTGMCTLRWRTTTARRIGASTANGRARCAQVITALTATIAAMCHGSATRFPAPSREEPTHQDCGVADERPHQHLFWNRHRRHTAHISAHAADNRSGRAR